jgi:hypothetical protein
VKQPALKLNKREIVLLFAMVMVGFFYFFYTFLLMPRLVYNGEVEKKFLSGQSELATLRAKTRFLDQMEEKGRSDQLKTGEIADFLSFVANKGALYSLDINSILPRAMTAEAEVGTETTVKGGGIDLQMKGSYLGLLNFLAAFEQGEIPAAVSSIAVSGGGENKVLDIELSFNTAFY